MLIGKLLKTKNKKFDNHSFSGLCFDSKSCKKNNIFFAIKGNKNDGHKYIDKAIKNGARTIIHKKTYEGFKNKILYLSFKNTRKILSQCSYKIFNKLPNNIIAVTGTNGKSSVADFYYQILRLNNMNVASIGTIGVKYFNKIISINNTTLDPISLAKHLQFLKKKKINNVILEASSHGLKQNRLDGLNISSAIFTNFSHDHLDYHKNLTNYLNSKLYLFKNLLREKSTVITDSSIKQFKKIKNISSKKNLVLKTILNKNNEIHLISHEFKNERQKLKIKFKNKIYDFNLNLIGKTQVKNVLMAIIAAQKSKLNESKIMKNIHKLKPVNGRFEKIGNLKNNSIVILDYAHTPDALKACLIDLKEQFENKKIKIVFGCGGDRDKYKRSKMGKITNMFCSKIYLTDDNPRNEDPKKIRSDIKKSISPEKIFEIPDRKKAISEAINNLETNEILVVAGKGHELIQDYGNKKKYFSDREVIKKFIFIKNKKLSNNIKVNILKENFYNQISKNLKLKNASINSKTIKKNEIFFAIKGKKKDGNTFIADAFKNGASLAFVNKFHKNKKNLQVKVPNSLKCLTDLSKKIRENFSGKIIAITGSCGKTSLKQMIGESINKFSNTTFSPKSYNNKYGLPLSLFNLNFKNYSGIFEIGMDKKGEIDYLSKILQPNVGVITNISWAHAKNFNNINEIASAKGELIDNIKKNGTILLNNDDSFFEFHKKKAITKGIKIISFGYKKNSNISVRYIKKNNNKYKIGVNIFNHHATFIIKNINKSFVHNLLATLGVFYTLGYTNNLKTHLFEKFSFPEGRGDISKIKLHNKIFYLIDESYNSNPMSMNSAIENINLLSTKDQKKHFIMGDMRELGKFSKKLHIKLSDLINSSSIDKMHIIGKFVKETYKNVRDVKKGKILSDHNQIYDLIIKQLNNNDYLMIKGSNSTGLNKFVKKLKNNKIYAL